MYTVEEFDKEKTKVMNYIMYKKRTEYEVKNKFKNTIQNDMLCDIIAYVKDAGYLDDTDYIERAIKEYMALKDLSIKEIEYKILTKGLDRSDIEYYICNNLIQKKQRTMEKEDIKRYLMKKGYNHQTIKEVF